MKTPPQTSTADSTERGPFLERLGIELVSAKEGKTTFRLTIAERHLRTHGILHGGVVATLLDTAMGRAVSTLCRDDQSCVTVQLNVNFIRPAWSGETLTITGEVQHSGRQTAVARGEIRTEAGMLVATGSGTFMFVARPVEGQPLFVQQPDQTLPSKVR
ncbi:MAG: PaaI family thioesterase [Planctomycetaceae bacterium]|nr:PaaI family thioesterase [Planctomycetaceae bacterium]